MEKKIFSLYRLIVDTVEMGGKGGKEKSQTSLLHTDWNAVHAAVLCKDNGILSFIFRNKKIPCPTPQRSRSYHEISFIVEMPLELSLIHI